MPAVSQDRANVGRIHMSEQSQAVIVRELHERKQKFFFDSYQRLLAEKINVFLSQWVSGYVREPVADFKTITDEISVIDTSTRSRKNIEYQLDGQGCVVSDRMDLKEQQKKDLDRLLNTLYQKYLLVKTLPVVGMSVTAPVLPATSTTSHLTSSAVLNVEAAPAPIVVPSVTTTEPATASLVPTMVPVSSPVVVNQSGLILELQDELEASQHACETARQAIATRELYHQEQLRDIKREHAQQMKSIQDEFGAFKGMVSTLESELTSRDTRIEQLRLDLLQAQSDTLRRDSEYQTRLAAVSETLHQSELDKTELQAALALQLQQNQRALARSSTLIIQLEALEAAHSRALEEVHSQADLGKTELQRTFDLQQSQEASAHALALDALQTQLSLKDEALRQRDERVDVLQQEVEQAQARIKQTTALSAEVVVRLQRTSTAQKKELDDAKALILQLQEQLQRVTEMAELHHPEPQATLSRQNTGLSEQEDDDHESTKRGDTPLSEESHHGSPTEEGAQQEAHVKQLDEGVEEVDPVELTRELIELPSGRARLVSSMRSDEEELSLNPDEEQHGDPLQTEEEENAGPTPRPIERQLNTSASFCSAEDQRRAEEEGLLKQEDDIVSHDPLTLLKGFSCNDEKIMNHLSALIRLVDDWKASENSSISNERLESLLTDTNTLLRCDVPRQRQALLESYQETIRDLPGHPSPWMKALGAVVMALSAALIACAWVVMIPVPFATPALTTVGVLGLGAGASFFKKGFVKQNSLYSVSNALASELSDDSSSDSVSSDGSPVNEVMETLTN